MAIEPTREDLGAAFFSLKQLEQASENFAHSVKIYIHYIDEALKFSSIHNKGDELTTSKLYFEAIAKSLDPTYKTLEEIETEKLELQKAEEARIEAVKQEKLQRALVAEQEAQARLDETKQLTQQILSGGN